MLNLPFRIQPLQQKEERYKPAVTLVATLNEADGSKVYSVSKRRRFTHTVIDRVSEQDAVASGWFNELLASLAGTKRQQQLSELGKDDSLESPEEIESKRNLMIASTGLVSVAAGTLFYAPLIVPSVVAVFYAYSHQLKDAYRSVVHERRANGNVLLSIIAAGATVGGFYFPMALAVWQGAMMRWLLAKTTDRSRKGLVDLLGDQPRSVWVAVDNTEIEIPFENLQIGDQVVIVAGQMIPIDGTISDGIASIDQHKLTGEGQSAEKTIGDRVLASTVVLSGRIVVQVEQTGVDTVAAQMGQILNQTADFNLSFKSRAETFIDRMVVAMLGLSVVTFPVLGLNQALAVLWAVPGYRMLVLGPMGMLNYLYLLSQRGILVKDGRSLEQLNNIDIVVFDKTGTLTTDMPTVTQIFNVNDVLPDELLTYAAAAEFRQTHPVALAILQAAEARQLDVPQIDHTHYEIGYGVRVTLGEKVIRVGSDRFMAMCGIPIPAQIEVEQARCQREGFALVYVAIDDQLGGAIELQPTIRPETRSVIESLTASGKQLCIISGDSEAPTRRLAAELGIDQYFANTLPENKADLVKQLQEEGRSVCFIGDGINDAIALKQANVSISLSGATTIATDTAQIVLMDGELTQLPTMFELAEEFNEHLDSTFAVSVVPESLGLAATFFFGWGFLAAVGYNVLCWVPQLSVVTRPLLKKRDKPKQNCIKLM